MSMRQILMIALGLSAIPLLAGFSDSPNFRIKTGLWQMTVIIKMNGKLPIPDDVLAQMPPAQRQNFEAAMKAQEATAAKPRIVKTCVTQEKLDRGFRLDASNEPNCEQTILANTVDTMEVHEECSDNKGTTTSNLHYEAVDPETVKGTIHVEVAHQGNNMVSDGSLQGKWISGSCGDIK
jgi:hypothetical protein